MAAPPSSVPPPPPASATVYQIDAEKNVGGRNPPLGFQEKICASIYPFVMGFCTLAIALLLNAPIGVSSAIRFAYGFSSTLVLFAGSWLYILHSNLESNAGLAHLEAMITVGGIVATCVSALILCYCLLGSPLIWALVLALLVTMVVFGSFAAMMIPGLRRLRWHHGDGNPAALGASGDSTEGGSWAQGGR